MKNMTQRVFLFLTLLASAGIRVAAQEDVTGTYMTNPSFEDGTNGWTVKNMATQSNAVFSIKNGTYYIESWVSIGSKLGDASVTQTLKALPQGNYLLTANALHIQQSGSGSTTNSGTEQTGAYLVAGNTKASICAMKQYSVTFSVLEAQADIEVGLVAEGATGNYLCLDNFNLQYMGEINAASYAAEVKQLVILGQEYLDKGIQNTVAETLKAAMQTAETALQGTGTDESGATTYDMEALTQAKAEMDAELKKAETSRAFYDTLAERIEYAQKLYGWWEGTSSKATLLGLLKPKIEDALTKMTDYTLTDGSLKSVIDILNSRIRMVDKKIYCSTSAVGTEDELNLPTSHWSFERSLQSKHWIIFWEKGYGTSAPASVESILNTADRVFELYADSLKFITINQGVSKTDNYKMIIRLRYTDEWEASGSGIDNMIGLLTLSRWAYTSREGQTLAHEIGHCFQYQTHCDNKDWNGWMYNWGVGNYNVFWEMCAQWQAYKYFPEMQFNNEWLHNTLNGLHKHPLAVDLRYNNYFIQDYFCHKHGMDMVGRLWNESRSPEDPLQAYMRIAMPDTLTAAQKLDKLGDEMWEFGARMATFDMDPIRTYGANTIGVRAQTNLTKQANNFWSPTAADCIENFGHNTIRLNAPANGKVVYAELVGEAGKSGYTAHNVESAGWKFGFVALHRDGTRYYSEIGTATYDNPEASIVFDCPAGCTHLWLVVSGAPTSYWTRDWIDWDGVEGVKEQWPYKVKLHQTNVHGYSNNNTYPAGIGHVQADGHPSATDNNVYSITGQLVRQGSTSLEGLPHGIYIVGGKKVVK